MLSTAQAQRDEMLTEGRERSTGLVAEAQQKKAAILEELGRDRGLLERKIEELSGFERDYRSRLHTYIQGQLAELTNTGSDEVPEEGEQHADAVSEPQPEHQG
jgi:cell division septum initiation protein DivIVA